MDQKSPVPIHVTFFFFFFFFSFARLAVLEHEHHPEAEALGTMARRVRTLLRGFERPVVETNLKPEHCLELVSDSSINPVASMLKIVGIE